MRPIHESVASVMDELLIQETDELPVTTRTIIGEGSEDDKKVSAADQKKVDAMAANKSWPDKAEDGKAFIVHWAGGRGIFAMKSKQAVKDWLKKTGSWAEIVSIKYGEPVHKGKKLKAR